MSSALPKDRYSHQFYAQIVLRSNIQTQKLAIKKAFPRTLKFNLDEPLNPFFFRKISKFLPKSQPSLKNPPVKHLLKQCSLMRNVKALSIKPEEAQAYIKKISLYFSRLNQLSICTQENSFAPMKIKGKVRPMRSLRTFCHNHELCQEFMTCARYVKFLKIKRSSINLSELKRFKRLETLYLLFNTKYITFAEQEKKFVNDLVKVISTSLPILQKIILKHELDPENNPYLPLQLHNLLEGRVEVNLIADLVDISNLRSPTNSIERIFGEINYSGIQRMNLNYAGIMKPVKRFAKWFHVPVYFRKELYLKLLKTILASHLAWIKLEPVIHSSHFNSEIRDTLLSLMKPNSRVNIPKITFIYCLDTIDESTYKIFLDLYTSSISSYDLVIVSTAYLTHEHCEKLENHYAQFLSRVQRYDVKFSLSITARTYKNFISLLSIIVPRVNLSRLKSLSVKIINPLSKSTLPSFAKLMTKSLACSPIKQLEISLSQEGAPLAQEIFEMVNIVVQKSLKLKRFALSHQNSDEYEEVFAEAFRKLRRQNFWVDLKYDMSREKGILYEQI